MFNVEHDVKITIDEEGLKALIIAEVARRHPNVVVDNIEFIQRRSPNTAIETIVKAHADFETALQPSVVNAVVDVPVKAETDAGEVAEQTEETPESETEPKKPRKAKPKKVAEEQTEEEQGELPIEDEPEPEAEEEDAAAAFLAAEEAEQSDDEEEDDPFA